MTTIEALFLPRPDGTYLPTQAAVGAWDPESLHGAAIAALLAGRLAAPDRTLARVTIDLLASVPNAVLTLDIGEAEGGRRAQRRQAVLSCNGRTVAIARALTIHTADLDLPPSATKNLSPFDPDAAPDLTTPHRSLAATIGWENFHSLAVATARLPVEGAAPGSHQWTSLTLPVVAGSEVTGTEAAAVAADFAANAVAGRLPFETWTFKNTDMTLNLSRPPAGTWIGIRTDAIVQSVGTGIGSTMLYDQCGHLGQSASTLIIERRRDRASEPDC